MPRRALPKDITVGARYLVAYTFLYMLLKPIPGAGTGIISGTTSSWYQYQVPVNAAALNVPEAKQGCGTIIKLHYALVKYTLYKPGKVNNILVCNT